MGSGMPLTPGTGAEFCTHTEETPDVRSATLSDRLLTDVFRPETLESKLTISASASSMSLSAVDSEVSAVPNLEIRLLPEYEEV